MTFFVFWMACAFATALAAGYKNLNVILYFFLALFLGPLALIIVLVERAPGAGGAAPSPSMRPYGSEADQLRRRIGDLEDRIEQLEKVVSAISGQDVTHRECRLNLPVGVRRVAAHRVSETFAPAASAAPAKGEERQEGFELVFGKYWMNRIGVILFVLGIGLFISYTFHAFAPVLKIALGYACACAFLFWGNRLERHPEYRKLGWGILGGAWGLFYLTTYAMHFIPATQLIRDPFLGLALLAVVGVSSVVMNLKYSSWQVTAITYVLAFWPVYLGGLTNYTIVYWVFVVGSLATIAYRRGWAELLVCGIIASYVWYFVLSVSGAYGYTGMIELRHNLMLLGVTWLIFATTLLIFENPEEDFNRIASGYVFNTAFFVLLGWGEFHGMNMASKTFSAFVLVLAGFHALLALLNRLLGQKRGIVVNHLLAFGLLAAGSLGLMNRLDFTYFLLIESAVAFGLGMTFREIAYRGLALMGFAVVFLLVLFGLIFSGAGTFLPILTVVIFFALGTIAGNALAADCLSTEERGLYPALLISAGSALLTFLVWRDANDILTLAWGMEGAGVLLLGFLSGEKAFRACGLAVLVMALIRVVFVDLMGLETMYRILAFIALGGLFLGISFVYSRFKTK